MPQKLLDTIPSCNWIWTLVHMITSLHMAYHLVSHSSQNVGLFRHFANSWSNSSKTRALPTSLRLLIWTHRLADMAVDFFFLVTQNRIVIHWWSLLSLLIFHHLFFILFTIGSHKETTGRGLNLYPMSHLNPWIRALASHSFLRTSNIVIRQ